MYISCWGKRNVSSLWLILFRTILRWSLVLQDRSDTTATLSIVLTLRKQLLFFRSQGHEKLSNLLCCLSHEYSNATERGIDYLIQNCSQKRCHAVEPPNLNDLDHDVEKVFKPYNNNLHLPGLEPGMWPWKGQILPLDHKCYRNELSRVLLISSSLSTHIPFTWSIFMTEISVHCMSSLSEQF